MEVSFEGEWKIDLDSSFVWDVGSGAYIPDRIGQELITIRLDGDMQHYEVLLGDKPTIRMGYDSRYDATDWVPYSVREIIGAEDEGEVTDFIERTRQRKTDFKVGQIYGLIRSIYVDERTHYRISKDAETGQSEYIMLRRLDEDGQSYTARVFRNDGLVSIIRRFIRR
ncbi:MAG: hypothetical protein CL472_03560 [Acidobacteria bacterium]|nr:hypothetical protein [Acidobacteriota bacterium]